MSVNPYPGYNFVVKWDGNYVAAVTMASGLSRTTAVVSFHEGGQPQSALRIPGQTDYAPVRLERGITTDTAFEDWAKLPWYVPNTGQIGSEVDMDHFRKNMQIEVYDEAGQPVLRYNLYNCWPSEYTALPELDAAAHAVGLASMTIEHEGWARDTRLTPPP